ncbi:putative actinidain [Dioscorea sansibarensis]
MAPLLLILIFFLSHISSFLATPTEHDESQTRLIFEGWVNKHSKSYNSSSEKEERYKIFKDNLRFINEHNAGNHSFRVGLNVFADLTNEEYRRTYLGFQLPDTQVLMQRGLKESNRYRFNGSHEMLPRSVDWRDKNAVVPVKNQGNCNSCWAFSVVAATEGINKIVKGKLISLSEQELVDCYNMGCQRGYTHLAFEFIVQIGGIDGDNDYPYKGRYSYCDTSKVKKKVVSIDGYQFVPRDENSLKKAVAYQPVSVAIEAFGPDFQLYTSGVYDGVCGTNLDHAVTAIGYGTDNNGEEYWLVKNSWGENWGEEGYVRIKRNTNSPYGKCGIAMFPTYPIKRRHHADKDNLAEVEIDTGGRRASA